jgi:HEAT repeat protein
MASLTSVLAMPDLIIASTLAAIALLVGLSSLLAAKKLARSRQVRRSARWRADALVRLRQGAPDVFVAARSVGRRARQDDILAVLEAGFPSLGAVERDRARDNARERGFVADRLAALTHRDPTIRGRAALILGRLGVAEAVGPLAARLADPDADVRHAAVRALGLVGDEDAAWVLVGALESGVVHADRILEHLGHPWAVPVLLEGAQIDQLRSVHGVLAEALGLAGDPRAASSLAALLLRGTPEERTRSCRALGRTGDQRFVRFLVRALGDREWPVRAQAAAALGRLGADDDATVRALEHGLSDTAWWVRHNCADALAGSALGTLALRRTLERSDDRYARERASEALAVRAVRDGSSPAVEAA